MCVAEGRTHFDHLGPKADPVTTQLHFILRYAAAAERSYFKGKTNSGVQATPRTVAKAVRTAQPFSRVWAFRQPESGLFGETQKAPDAPSSAISLVGSEGKTGSDRTFVWKCIEN